MSIERDQHDSHLTDLHAAVMSGDDTALNAVSDHALRVLVPRLRRRFRRIDEQAVTDAVVDALLDYIRHPQRYDHHRRVPLEHYLYACSRRNVTDWLRSASRRKLREQEYGCARSPADVASEVVEHDDRPELLRVLLGLAVSDRERSALRCWLADEADTAGLAHALGVIVLGEREQRREVKRFKDRLLKRLIRKVVDKRSLLTSNPPSSRRIVR